MMGAKGMVMAEVCHPIVALHPVDVNGGKNSDVWSMANAAHASICVCVGVSAAGLTITVEACDDFVPTAVEAIAFAVYKEETALGDTLGARTAVASTGLAISTNDNIFYCIEIDAAELSAGKPNLRVVLSDPSASVIGCVTVCLSGLRYAGEQNATAIA